MMTRKSFLTGAAASAITGSASAALTGECIEGNWGRARGLLGGAFMGCMLAQNAKSGPTARDYVQDGLFAMYDGIENDGWGKTKTGVFTSLVDLVGNTTFSFTGSFYGTMLDGHAFYIATYLYLTIPDISFVNTGFTFQILRKDARPQYLNPEPYAGLPSFLDNFYFTAGGSNNYIKMFGTSTGYFYTQRLPNTYGYLRTSTLDGNGGTLKWYNNKTLVGTLEIAEGDQVSGRSSRSYGTSRGDGTYRHGYNAIRIYSRALSAEEIAHNYEIDRARFGID